MVKAVQRAPPVAPNLSRIVQSAEDIRRAQETKERKAAKAERRRRKAAAAAGIGSIQELPASTGSDKAADPAAVQQRAPQTPVAFLFPGQGSQAVGMLKVSRQAQMQHSNAPFAVSWQGHLQPLIRCLHREWMIRCHHREWATKCRMSSLASGALQATKDLPAVAEMLRKAQEVLGYDLLKLCLEGPKEQLDETRCCCSHQWSHQTVQPANLQLVPSVALAALALRLTRNLRIHAGCRYAQPALFVAGLAAVEALRKEDAAAVQRCSVCAGLSLGEYTALVFAGALSFEDGLKASGFPR